jgi:hypothetical protein
MKDTPKLDLLQLAKNLTCSTDIEVLINASSKLEEYLKIKSYIAPSGPQNFDEFLEAFPVQHPIHGAIKMCPYQYQLTMGSLMANNRFTIFNTARQMGTTTIMSAYGLWTAMQEANSTVVVMAPKYTQSLEIMDRIRYAYENMSFGRPGTTEYNKGAISFDNGSRIIARTATEDSLKGISPSLILLDNAAFIPYSKAASFWTSLTTLATGGKIVVSSTPSAPTGLFYQLWTGSPANGFVKMAVPWSIHPDRDTSWKIALSSQIGAATFKQEHECEFV